MARPKLQLDEQQIIELAKIHCTMKEISAVMKCSVDTLERNYADIIKEGKEIGKTSLRRYMWKAAEKGNTAMLIWLSKQKSLLGMCETPQEEIVREDSLSGFQQFDKMIRRSYDSSR